MEARSDFSVVVAFVLLLLLLARLFTPVLLPAAPRTTPVLYVWYPVEVVGDESGGAETEEAREDDTMAVSAMTEADEDAAG